MNRVTLARTLAVATILFAEAFYTVGAAIKPGYTHAASFISELNAAGTPWAGELGLFGFVPLGTLFAAFLLTANGVARVHGASRVGILLLSQAPSLSARGAGYLRAVAVAWLAVFFIMLAPELAPIRGVLQRIADGLLGSVVLFIAWRLLGPVGNARPR